MRKEPSEPTRKNPPRGNKKQHIPDDAQVTLTPELVGFSQATESRSYPRRQVVSDEQDAPSSPLTEIGASVENSQADEPVTVRSIHHSYSLCNF